MRSFGMAHPPDIIADWRLAISDFNDDGTHHEDIIGIAEPTAISDLRLWICDCRLAAMLSDRDAD